jgi:hypothetical protein
MNRSSVVVLAFCMMLLASLGRAQGWVDVSNPSNTPGGSDGGAMVYDEARNCCLLIRGGSTWRYDASGWSQVNSANPATVSTQGAQVVQQRAVYDSQRQKVIVALACWGQNFGCCRRGIDIRMAEWDGTDWVGLPAIITIGLVDSGSGPAPFSFGYAIAYDRIRGELLLHATGLESNPLIPFTRTYTFSSGQWQTRSTLIAPPVSVDCVRDMFFEEHTGKAVMVAQSPASYWEWNGQTGNWAQRFPTWLGTPITNGSFGPIAYVPGLQSGVGLGVDLPYTSRTLTYGNGNIQSNSYATQPSVRYRYSIAFDRARSKIVMHGGSGFADTWELTPGPSSSYTYFGLGCAGSAGVPYLDLNTGVLPVSGQRFSVLVKRTPFFAHTFMMVGASNTNHMGLTLPYPLASVGMPGCDLLTGPDCVYPCTNVFGTAVWDVQLPPGLGGQSFYNQAVIFDATANQLGVLVSNGGEAVVGY